MVYCFAVASNVNKPLLQIRKLKVHIPVYGGFFSRQIGTVRAVDGLSLDLAKGEIVGLVGESGCGKTTTGRAILGLVDVTEGQVLYNDKDLAKLDDNSFRPLRKKLQMIFQDPYGSLDPRMSVGKILEEPLIVHGVGNKEERKQQVVNWIKRVGLNEAQLDRFPHEFSGGQRQRIAIARSLILEPEVVIADEPVSALDVSIQAQIINFLQDLAADMGLTMLFIAHDISVVHHIAHRMAVMYLGRIVEVAKGEELLSSPCHPYTYSLISAVPQPSTRKRKKRVTLPGEPPSPLSPPVGCHLHPRCPAAIDICHKESPLLSPLPDNEEHLIACHRAGEAVDAVRDWQDQIK